eukprot:UN01604
MCYWYINLFVTFKPLPLLILHSAWLFFDFTNCVNIRKMTLFLEFAPNLILVKNLNLQGDISHLLINLQHINIYNIPF